MPQRFLRPTITTSRKWNRCTWPAQSGYIRLLTVVDDFGRYFGEHDILRGHLFARRDDITTQTVADICSQWEEHGLVEFYKHDGETYLQITNWHEKARSASKFPDPNRGESEHLQTIDNKCSPPSPSPSPSPSGGACAPAPRRSGADIVNWDKELVDVRKRIKSIRSQYDSHQDISPPDKAILARLKAREKKLMQLLGREV